MKKTVKHFAAVLFFFLILMILPGNFLFASREVKAATTVTGTYRYSSIKAMLKKVNDLRASKGASALKLDSELTEIAMERAAEITVLFQHRHPDGGDVLDTSIDLCGENIAMTSGYADHVSANFNNWKNSPGHYANMVRSAFQRTGLGCFEYNGGFYWVQVFGYSSNASFGSLPADRREAVRIRTSPSDPIYLNTPALTKIQVVTGDNLQFFWNTVRKADGYYIYRKADREKGWTKIGTVKSPTGHSYTDRFTKLGMGYRYTVRAYCNYNGKTYLSGYDTAGIYGYQVFSKELTRLTSVKTEKGKGVRLTWNARPKAERYAVYRKTDGTDYQLIGYVADYNTFLDRKTVSATTDTYTVAPCFYQKSNNKLIIGSMFKGGWYFRAA